MPAEERKRDRDGLNDEQWKLIKNLFPKQVQSRKWSDDRLVLDDILWILPRRRRRGATCQERYGKWQTIYDRFACWRRDGTLSYIFPELFRLRTQAHPAREALSRCKARFKVLLDRSPASRRRTIRAG